MKTLRLLAPPAGLQGSMMNVKAQSNRAYVPRYVLEIHAHGGDKTANGTDPSNDDIGE